MEESEPITKHNFGKTLNQNMNNFLEKYKHETKESKLIFNIEKEEDILPMARKRYLILNGCIGEKTELDKNTPENNEELYEFKEVLAILVRHVMENFHLNLTEKERKKIKPGKNYLFYIVKNSKELKILLAISGFGKDGRKGSSEHYKLTQNALDKLFENNNLDLKGYKVKKLTFIPFSRKKEKFICMPDRSSLFYIHSKNIKSQEYFLIKMTLIFKLLQGKMIFDFHARKTVLRLQQNSEGFFQDMNAASRAFEKFREKLNDRKAKCLTYFILAATTERISSFLNYNEGNAAYCYFSENLDYLNKQNYRIHFHCEDEIETFKRHRDSHEARVYSKLLLKLWHHLSNVDIAELGQYLSQCSEDNLIKELCINQKFWKDEGTHYMFSIEKLEKYDSIIKIRPPCMYCMLYFPLEYALHAFYEHGLAFMPFNIKNMVKKFENLQPVVSLSVLLHYERAIKLNSYLESKDVFNEIVKKSLGEKFLKSKLLSLLDDVIIRNDKTLLKLLELRMHEHRIPLKHREALLKAARYGCSDIIEYLIEKSDADFKTNIKRQTAMHFLVRKGDLNSLKKIKEKYRGDIVKEIFRNDKTGQSPVVLAAALTNKEVFEFLRITVNDEESFYNHIKIRNVMFYPIKSSCLSMLKHIWNLYNKRINAECELWTNKMEKYTLLGQAAQKGNYEIIEYLINKICSLKLISKEMELDLAKSLLIAIVEGCTEVIEILMNTLKRESPAGMKLIYEWRSRTGESALHYLTFLRSDSLVNQFLTNKVLTTDLKKELCSEPILIKKRVSDIDYDTTVTFEVTDYDFQKKNNAHMTPLHAAMITENKAVIECLVKLHKLDVNVKSPNGSTLLHVAAATGHVGNVTALLEGISSNIDDFINAEDDAGDTPLHYAALHGSFEVLTFFIEKGANLNASNKRGDTPLHFAVSGKHFEVVEHLLENGANDDVENLDGCTPLCLAIAYNDDDMIKKLSSEKKLKTQPE